jgi:hypothetical protein
MDLRPLGVGEILDLGIKIYRRRFGTLVRAVAVVVVPVAVVTAIVQTSITFQDGDTLDGGDAAAVIVGTLVVTVLTYLASQLATAASFEIVSGDYLEETPTWQASLLEARKRLRSLVWVSFLYFGALLLGTLACIIPGVYLYVAFAVYVPALLFEDLRGRAALRRSKGLLQGRWWPAFGVLVVTQIITSIINGALNGLLLGIISSADNEAVDALARALSTSVSSILTTPFAAAVITVLYFDMRVRKEGFDLELLARRIGVEPPAGAARDLLAPEPPSAEPPFWPPPPGWTPGGPSTDDA